ncbi:hypothetical protein ASF26_11820 [Methylobacterium sp. Leaf93]|nr:hypothetical protein ASF26_11820 [Methylobacterium sp. Leaf93]
MARGARVMQKGYSPGLAARHLLRGPLNARDAMREILAQGGLSELWRLALFVLGTSLVVLVDLSDTSPIVLLSDHVGTLDSGKAVALLLASYTTLFLGTVGALYLVISVGTWAFARATSERPSLATVRTSVALATWVAVLPSLGLTLIFEALNQGTAGNVLIFFLGLAYIGLCLSEATGLASAKAMAFAMAGSTLMLTLVLILAVGLFGDVLSDFFAGDAP